MLSVAPQLRWGEESRISEGEGLLQHLCKIQEGQRLEGFQAKGVDFEK